jgi:hypothetical protein
MGPSAVREPAQESLCGGVSTLGDQRGAHPRRPDECVDELLDTHRSPSSGDVYGQDAPDVSRETVATLRAVL